MALILSLPILEHIIDVKGFLDLTYYYRQFIYFYAKNSKYLTRLTKKINTFDVWIEVCTKAFNKFKKQLS